MVSSTVPTIKLLKSATQSAWIDQAIANLDVILLDHSHCERKAAGVALNFLFRYPAHELLVRRLTAIAQEELEHFEQVNCCVQYYLKHLRHKCFPELFRENILNSV